MKKCCCVSVHVFVCQVVNQSSWLFITVYVWPLSVALCYINAVLLNVSVQFTVGSVAWSLQWHSSFVTWFRQQIRCRFVWCWNVVDASRRGWARIFYQSQRTSWHEIWWRSVLNFSYNSKQLLADMLFVHSLILLMAVCSCTGATQLHLDSIYPPVSYRCISLWQRRTYHVYFSTILPCSS